ncbi:MAG TPA: Type 1 glutamine amidotransferase-like domain-containing protein [bacterium]|nr:Type 1 glutamine amidotransferase-like domain-containing protein [bacterium]
MSKIVAISCSKVATPALSNKKITKNLIGTFNADKELVKLCGKKRPTLLFIPTASLDSADYVGCISRYFNIIFGCKIQVLYLTAGRYSHKEARDKILKADIIYVGGGDTLKMMHLWRKYGIDKLLCLAAGKNTVLAGVSAGGICWFDGGNSDSRRKNNPQAGLIKVQGLGFIKAIFSPHYKSDASRKAHLKRILRHDSRVAIATDDYCAIEIIDDKFKIIKNNNKSNIYKVYWKNKKFFHERLANDKGYLPLEMLLKK